MKKRGSSGLIGLQRKFRAMDKDGSKTLSKQEFKIALQDMGFKLNDGEVFGLFEYFDLDKSGTIDFEEVLHSLRDPLSNKRIQLIHMAFAVIDKDGNGVVDAAEVASSYDASMHPAVITGTSTKMQCCESSWIHLMSEARWTARSHETSSSTTILILAQILTMTTTLSS